MIVSESKVKVSAISANIPAVDIEIIKIYIQGAVYSFCKNNPNSWFSVRTLFGGENTDWSNTPLNKIYNYHIKEQSNNPLQSSAIDVGRLLKSVLADDKTRVFEMRKGFKTSEYRQVNN